MWNLVHRPVPAKPLKFKAGDIRDAASYNLQSDGTHLSEAQILVACISQQAFATVLASSIFTPHACARGKAIVLCFFSVVVRRRRHENRQISRSRHLSDSKAQRISRIRQKKTGFSMPQIVWHGSRKSQIVRFVGHTYRPRLLQAMCFELMRTTGGKGGQQIHDRAAAAARCCNSQMQMQRAGYVL